MPLKMLAVAAFVSSLYFNGFTQAQNNDTVPFGYQLLLLGWMAIGSFKPVWVWSSYLANFGFLFCCFEPSSKTGDRLRRGVAIVSLALGLTFLAVQEYYASGSVGHNTRYYWTPIKPAAGYYLWLLAILLMALHSLLAPRRETPKG